MFMDNNLEFADATSVGTPNGSTGNVGDIIDTGSVSALPSCVPPLRSRSSK